MQQGEILENPTDKYCEICDYRTSYSKDLLRHQTTRKHIIQVEENRRNKEKSSKSCKKYHCENCDYHTDFQKDYEKHLVTQKHQIKITGIQHKFECETCKKAYSSKRNLGNHTSKCHSKLENLLTVTDPSSSTVFTQEVILELVKQNKELQSLLVEQNNKFMEEMKNSKMTVTNSNNNSNNNHFNIQFFLNTQCKDAINLMDFLDSLKVQIEDLEKTGQLGYVDGISRIFVNGLKEMDVCMRPIHCSDLKRETVYVKDENKWDKDDTDKTKLKYAVKRVAQKNLAQIRPWIEQHPECKDTSTPESETFVQLSHHAIGGCSTTETDKLEEKIMKNILKEIVLDKK